MLSNIGAGIGIVVIGGLLQSLAFVYEARNPTQITTALISNQVPVSSSQQTEFRV